MATSDVHSDLIKYSTSSGEVQLSKGIIKKYLGGGLADDQEIMMFLSLCKYQQLNPFLREVYLIKYSKQYPATMVVGKEVFTKRAAAEEDFNGFSAGVWVKKEDGTLEERTGSMVLSGEELVGGWARVYRKSWEIPVEATVSFDEYVGMVNDEFGKPNKPNKQWSSKPGTMIRKVALVQALREAFPERLAGMLDGSEVGADELPQEPVTVSTKLTDEDGYDTLSADADKGFEGKQPPTKEQPKPEQTAESVAKMCRAAIVMLTTKGTFQEEDAVKQQTEVAEMAVNDDIQALQARHLELRDKYMAAVNKSAEAL